MFQRIFFFLVFAPLFVFSSNINPARGRVFNDSIIVSVFITINTDSLTALYKVGNECSNHEYPVSMVWSDGIEPNDTVSNVGLRLKGNTSRFAQKKSFKLSFNTFKSGRNFYDVEKLNLNGAHNDPSIIREKLYWDAMYKNNAPALRCNYVKLFVNGNYYGLYINVENLDEVFTQSRFGNNNGNLYKCYYGADLTYKGVNGNFYKATGTFCGKTQRVYELQNNTSTDNYQGLADFINVLNNLPNDSLYASKIKKYFNVEGYLKILALEVAAGHWDNYASNSNNFFLYENTASNQVEYISYDADNTFGVTWGSDDWGTKNVYQFNGGKTRPLFTKLLAVPEFKNKFDYYLREIALTIYDTAIIFPRIDYIHNQIWTAAIADSSRTKDYGFTVGQFHNSFIQTIGVTHVKYGLKPYFTTRTTTIKQQTGNNNIIPVLIREKHNPEVGALSSTMRFSIHAYDDQSLSNVRINYTYNLGTGFISAIIFDDGLHNDGVAGDGEYGFELPPNNAIDTLIFYFTATSNTNQTARYPSIDNLSIPIGVKSNLKLRINELMAKNNSIIKDDFNEYDDWLEIYSMESSNINLGTIYLSNNINAPFKFKLPSVNLAPNSFALLWCDNQTTQGAYHVNFKLSATYEWIGLFDVNGLLIDSISYNNLGDNISLGRTIDGAGNMLELSKNTPGYSNSGFNYGIHSDGSNSLFAVSPNPTINSIIIKNNSLVENEKYSIRNLNGQIVLEGILRGNETELSLEMLPDGTYILQCGNDFFKKITKIR